MPISPAAALGSEAEASVSVWATEDAAEAQAASETTPIASTAVRLKLLMSLIVPAHWNVRNGWRQTVRSPVVAVGKPTLVGLV